MMSWTPTPTRTAVSTLSYLWCQPAWRSSDFAEPMRLVLTARLEDTDDVNRLHVAQVAHLLALNDEAGFELARDRLLREPHPLVSARLVWGLLRYVAKWPEEVDSILPKIVAKEPWSVLLVETEGAPEQLESLEIFTTLTLTLAIRYHTPAALELTQTWLTEPAATAAAGQALSRLRDWLELTPEQGAERARAFDMMDTAIGSLAHVRQSEGDSDLLGRAYITADVLTRNINIASSSNGETGVPDQEFVARALSALAGLAQFKHPRITHSLIGALGKLAPVDPAKAFQVAAAAVGTGDNYTYDQIAAAETTALIERYLAEFRATVVADDSLLSAIRSVLHAFVDAGWPAAIALAYRLSEAFR